MADKNISNENLIPDTSDVVKTEKKSGKGYFVKADYGWTPQG